MQAIRDGGHTVRELGGVGNESVVIARIASCTPAVVQDHIVVAQVLETVVDNQLRGLEEERLRDITTESIPVVP